MMADVKISDLPAATTLASGDAIPVVQSGATKKATVAQIRAASATAAQGAKADSALQPVVAAAGIGAGGFAKHFLATGGEEGNFACAGIKVGDELNMVIHFHGILAAIDLTSEYTITSDGAINNTGGTASTGGTLLVQWTKLTV